MKIEVGEYVRNKEGKIIKVTWVGQAIVTNDRYTMSKLSGEITKHSKNIVDLIEVGDLVQLKGEEKLKYEVLKISWSPSKGKHIHIINPFRTEGGKDVFIEDIKLILTSEQFENNSYRLE